MIFAALFELVMVHILHRKKLDDVGAEYLTKIAGNVQKKVKPVSLSNDLLYDANICHDKKKSSK